MELYAPEYLNTLRRKNHRLRTALTVLSGLALLVCIGLCIGVNTANARPRLLWILAVNLVVGWFVIYQAVCRYRPARRELAHGEHLNKAERETLTGTVEDTGTVVRIRNSVNARKLRVKTGTQTVTVNINNARAGEVLGAGNPLTLYLAHGFVTAWEVHHADP